MSDGRQIAPQAPREVRVPGRQVQPAQAQHEATAASRPAVIEGEFTEVKAAKNTDEPDKPKGRKLGADHLKSMGRLGFHELAKALQPLPDSNITAPEEPGVFGNENAPQRPIEEQRGNAGRNQHLDGIVRSGGKDRDQEMVRYRG